MITTNQPEELKKPFWQIGSLSTNKLDNDPLGISPVECKLFGHVSRGEPSCLYQFAIHEISPTLISVTPHGIFSVEAPFVSCLVDPEQLQTLLAGILVLSEHSEK